MELGGRTPGQGPRLLATLLGAVLAPALYSTIMQLLPRCFSIGEGALMAQGATILAMAAAPLTWLGATAVWTVLEVLPAKPWRLLVLLYWVGLLAVTLPGLKGCAGHSNVPQIIIRKVYHLLAGGLFIPVFFWDLQLLCLSLAIGFAALVLLEVLRHLQLPRIGQAVQHFMQDFVDERDSGVIYVTHFTLLLGLAIPMWLSIGLPGIPAFVGSGQELEGHHQHQLPMGQACASSTSSSVSSMDPSGSLTADHCSRLLLVMAGLSGMSLQQLKELSLVTVEVSSSLHHLPAQLEHLTFSFTRTSNDQIMALDHLTALTSLEAGYDDGTLMPADRLPPNLVSLSVTDVWSSRCILPLKRLEKLHVHRSHGTMSAAELQQLSSLTALTDVQLGYVGNADIVDEAAAGWSKLPLTSLYVSTSQGPEAIRRSSLLELVNLPHLCTLRLAYTLLDCTAQDFANILSQLTALTKLSLSSVVFTGQPPEGEASAVSARFEPVAAAFRNMLGLQVLEMWGMPISYKAAMQLSKLSQLESLILVDCHLQDASLIAIALGLVSTLEYFEFDDNEDITDAVLPVLRNTMGTLDWDAFEGTSVTQEAWELFMDENSFE
eukprot:gene5753-5992_t